MIDIKNNFQYKMKLNFNILVNQVKIAGNSGNIENFNTCRKILAHENREKFISLFYCKSEEERENLRLMLQQAYVITHVMNIIGLINISKFDSYVKSAFVHWIKSFGKWRSLKPSIHWTLGHLSQLIALNNGFSLAECSENSIEATIKKYRYLTKHLSRQTSFKDNTDDCLKVLDLLSKRL